MRVQKKLLLCFVRAEERDRNKSARRAHMCISRSRKDVHITDVGLILI